jgi:hypothetical protein
MPTHRHPTDVLVDDLVGLYASSVRRLELLVAIGLRRGLNPARVGQVNQRAGDATLAYRARQLAQARAILDELDRQAGTLGPLVIGRAYGATLTAVDAMAGRAGAQRAGLGGAFGRVHVAAVEVLAGNLTDSLRAASQRAGANIELVFNRASQLEGALPGGGRVAGVPFIGRRVDDPYRRVALETIAGGLISLDTRRQVSAELVRRLVGEGVTDAITGYVDRAGRRWRLEDYADMVARTTTREASTAATVNRVLELGDDLVAVSTHRHKADECSSWEGRTFSLSGRDPRHERLTVRPPFHPRCVHVLGPATASLDDFEAELERRVAAAAGITAPAPPPTVRPDLPPTVGELAGEQPPPFPSAEPSHDDRTAARLEAQRITEAIADPGPEAGAGDAWAAWVKAEHRKANRALNLTLGDDLAKYIDRKWGRDAGIRRRLLAGELTRDEAEELAFEEYQRVERRQAERAARAELDYGLERKPIPCFICGWFKSRPSNVCDHCGDDPVPTASGSGSNTFASERADFDRAYGYSGRQ